MSPSGDPAIPIDTITQAQIDTAKELDEKLPKGIDKPHRFFSPTQCYGTSLTDEWIQGIIKRPEKQPDLSDLQKTLNHIQQLILQIQIRFKYRYHRFGGVQQGCFQEDNRG